MAIAGRDQGKRLPKSATPRGIAMNIRTRAMTATIRPGRKLRHRRLTHIWIENKSPAAQKLISAPLKIIADGSGEQLQAGFNSRRISAAEETPVGITKELSNSSPMPMIHLATKIVTRFTGSVR